MQHFLKIFYYMCTNILLLFLFLLSLSLFRWYYCYINTVYVTMLEFQVKIKGMVVLHLIWRSLHIKYLYQFQRFYRYHETLQERTLRVNPALAATNQNAPSTKRIPYGLIFKQSFVQLYNIFIVFFVSLAIFPALHSGKLFSMCSILLK